MLVLTRRVGEAILIDGGVRVTVVGVRGGQIRLGIEAPPSVGVRREESAARRPARAATQSTALSPRQVPSSVPTA